MSSKKGKKGCCGPCCYSPCCYCAPPVYMITTPAQAAPAAAPEAAPPPPAAAAPKKKRKGVPRCCCQGEGTSGCCCNSPDWCVSSSSRRTGTKTECLQGYMCTYEFQQKKTTVMSDGSLRVTYINSPNVHHAISSNRELKEILSAKTDSSDRTGSWSSDGSRKPGGGAPVIAVTIPSNSSGSIHAVQYDGTGSAELTAIQMLPKPENSDFLIMGPSRSGSNRSVN